MVKPDPYPSTDYSLVKANLMTGFDFQEIIDHEIVKDMSKVCVSLFSREYKGMHFIKFYVDPIDEDNIIYVGKGTIYEAGFKISIS